MVLTKVTPETQAIRHKNLPSQMRKTERRIAQSKERIAIYSQSQNQRMLSFWLGRLRVAERKLDELQQEFDGRRIAVKQGGRIFTVTVEEFAAASREEE